jgi:hypothetical protein
MRGIGWVFVILGILTLVYTLKNGGTVDAGELVYNMGIDNNGFMKCIEDIEETKVYDEFAQKKQMFYVLYSNYFDRIADAWF